MAVNNVLFAGPGWPIAGLAGELVQEDGPQVTAASTTTTLKMTSGPRSGETVLAQVIECGLIFTAAAGTYTYTDAEMAAFKDLILTSISGSSSLDNIVTTSPAIGAGTIDQACRVGLRLAAGGTLDNAGGSISVGASGVLVVEVLIPHANPITGLDNAPDVSLLNSTWNITTGSNSVSLGSLAFTFTSRTITTYNILIRNRPGSLRSHLGIKVVTSNQSNDQLDSQERLVHLVVGSAAPTYATALAALNNSGVYDPRVNNYTYYLAGKNPFNSQGYLNNYRAWNVLFEKAVAGGSPLPGVDRGASGPQSYQMVPFYTWDGRSIGNTATGEIVINNAALVASNRLHLTVEVRRGGAR